MNEPRPAPERHDAEYFRNLRVSKLSPGLIGEKEKPVQQIKPPQIAHYVGAARPIVTTPPSTPIRVTREEIERALGGSFTYSPHMEEIVDRILLETSRMDGFADGSPPFKEHHETVLRLLREIGLYPI